MSLPRHLVVGTHLVAALLIPLRTEAQSAGAAGAKSADDIARLRWLAGCWEQRTATRTTREQWMVPDGGTMLGTSRTVSGGATRAWEWLRIAPIDGRLSYIAIPSGQTETAFAATTVDDTLAVFENPSHDFPQVIAYRRIRADSIVARISAVTNGRPRGMDIPMRRVSCEPASSYDNGVMTRGATVPSSPP